MTHNIVMKYEENNYGSMLQQTFYLKNYIVIFL